MNRNQESMFNYIPAAQVPRSVFEMKAENKTTFNVGELIPFFVEQDVMPGDTFKYTTKIVARTITPKFPTMDNLLIDTYFFFVPNRILWKHWKELMGENRDGAWAQTTEYQTPKIKAPENGWEPKTIMDYMGIVPRIKNIKVNALPVRAYVKIYNEWFRNQNLIAPKPEIEEDKDTEGDSIKTHLGGKPYKVMKYKDYFTSALPDAQKGTPITLPLGTIAPIRTSVENTITGTQEAIRFAKASDGNYPNNAVGIGVSGGNTGTGIFTDIAQYNNYGGIYPNNSYADLTKATAATINALRLAVATQRILETDARGGTRYTEIIKNHFGVDSPDGRQQRPEYLGGNQVPMQIYQTEQTSETTSNGTLGTLGAWAHMEDINESFTKSFTEHGIIMGLATARYIHTYQQGINRSWFRSNRLDYYWTELANLGEQPIYNKEIFVQGNEKDDEVFGYQERYAEYRFKINTVTAEMRSTYPQSLDVWHYGDKYNSLPMLGEEWINETEIFVDRTLAVSHSISNQIQFNSLIEITATRPIPLYSIPGMLNHF